jgi:TonB family protein
MKLRQQVSKRVLITMLVSFVLVPVVQAQQNQGAPEIRVIPVGGQPEPRPITLPTPIKGNELQASAIKRALPKYPPDLEIDQLSGVVIVSVTINKEGNVHWAGALTGHPMLRNAAVEALRSWEWEPTLIKGVAQEVEGKIRFDFDGNGIVSINTSNDPEVVDPRVIYRAELLKKLEGNLEELRAAPSPALYEKVAEGYYALSRIQEAIATYKEGISRFPREINLYTGWAGIYATQGMIGTHGEQNQPEEMLKVLELGAQIRIEPDSPINIREQFCGLLWGLGSTYLAKDRYVEAKETLERALSFNPPEKLRGILYLALGQTFVKLGDKESAITMSQKLLELGDKKSAMELLGSLCHKLSGLGDKKSMMEVVHLMEKISQMEAPKPKF